MKKIILLLMCVSCILAFSACSKVEEPKIELTPEPIVSEIEAVPEETAQPISDPIEVIEIYSTQMWNEFAESYNKKREEYAEYVTVEVKQTLDFKNSEFVPLVDGFSGRIVGQEKLSEDERKDWIETRKKWPQDYSGTFVNISSFANEGNSLFGKVKRLEIANVGFANIYLDGADCLIAESAEDLELKDVRVTNCTLLDGKAIMAINTGGISVEKFIAESCFITGYEYMSGLVAFVGGDAKFEDVFMCRCSFILSPDNGGSGLWGAGVGIMAKSVDGMASFENIDIYACNTTALYTNALVCSAGDVELCKNISLENCNFINYRDMESEFTSGLITNIGDKRFMEMSAFEENVSFKNCNVGGEYTQEDFNARGYNIENCIFTSRKKEPTQ